MKIILEVIKAPAKSHLQGQQFEVDESGGTIGRAESNTWVLPDPLRYLSSIHARIDYCDNHYVLTDESTNGVFINMQAKAIGKGNQVSLRPGDQLRLSGYLLEVMREDDIAPPRAATESGSSQTRELPKETLNAQLQGLRARVNPNHTLASLPEEVAAALAESKSAATPILHSEDDVPDHHPDFMHLQSYANLLGLSGLSLDDSRTLPQETSEVVHTTVINLIRLLHARTRVKEHFGINITGLQEAENNPLKFALTLEGALPNLFDPQKRTKTAAQSVNDAFNDLADHQIALLEGLKAGIDSLLSLLDPELIETQQKMKYSSPGSRQADPADLWARYQQVYTQLFQDNNAKFNQIVGLSLIQAYDASIAELKAKRKTGDNHRPPQDQDS